ncbi:MAG TPA: presqualene diphosphate synthase HpnD [Ignavibacteriaceae bacterium]|nr:presqualene diphosphate synthase HpnD [Ignavibacteriaceae bacterium]
MSEAKNISKNSKSSFYYAFNLLPAAKRDAMNTVYAFCRKTDDIVDEDVMSQEMKSQTLTKWRSEFENALKGDSEYSLLNTLGTTIAQFNIPLDPFFNLIKGMEMDLNYNRYENFEDLRLYCYRVASTVGLMCIEIFGYKHKSAKDFAENLGIALQLTNILRDIKKDALKNRIYLPREDLRRFNYSEEELLTSVYNNNFVSLMRFEVERANIYFDKATRLLHMDDKVSMFAARAMQHIYHRLLDRIVENNYDIFSNHVKVSKFEKVGIALGVWVKYNLVYQ